MPCLFKNYNQRIGPVIETSIGNEEIVKGKDFKIYKSLIDTGASLTCVSQKVIKELNLKRRGKIPITTPAGKTEQEIFTVYLTFPFMLESVEDNKFSSFVHVQTSAVMFSLRVLGSYHRMENYDVLLGRDIICKGVFSITPDHFSFCL